MLSGLGVSLLPAQAVVPHSFADHTGWLHYMSFLSALCCCVFLGGWRGSVAGVQSYHKSGLLHSTACSPLCCLFVEAQALITLHKDCFPKTIFWKFKKLHLIYLSQPVVWGQSFHTQAVVSQQRLPLAILPMAFLGQSSSHAHRMEQESRLLCVGKVFWVTSCILMSRAAWCTESI